MRLELQQNLRPELRLKMSPQLIQRIEILQLSSLDLKEMIQKELMENEVLEVDEPVEDKSLLAEKEKELAGDEDKYDEDKYDQDLERLSALAEMNERSGPGSGVRRTSGEGDPKLEAMQNTASHPVTLQEHLKNQLNLADTTAEVRELAEQIVFNINEKGYVMYPLEEIRISLEKEYTEAQMEEALDLVQSFEPRGVGARSFQECLLLQLDESRPNFHLMRKLIQNHVEDVSRNKLPKVARELGIPLATLQKLIQEIAHLDPIPGRSFRTDDVPYVFPDAVVELIDGRYEIRLENNYYPRLAVSKAFIEMCRNRSLDPKLRAHMRGKIASAKWLIESILQRKSTLQRVVTEIIEYQTGFLDHGPKNLKPLKMQDIADKIGIHVSTVSRAISDKYVQTHRGIFPLKFFFTGATTSADGTVQSRLSVKQKVREIIDREDKAHPLSDQDIVEKLAEKGMKIARRTVTKYRKALKLPSSRERRVY
jgi:RNA polymerase sigma-54 factor